MTKTVTVDAVDKEATKHAAAFEKKVIGDAPLAVFDALARFTDNMDAHEAAALDPTMAGLIGMGAALERGVKDHARDVGKSAMFGSTSAMEAAWKLARFVMRLPLGQRDETLWQIRRKKR